MLLTIFVILLAINVIGFLNRKKAWSKIFLVSQVFVVGGLVVMFNVYTSQTGIQGIQAKKDGKDIHSKVDQIQDLARNKKDNLDTIDAEKEKQSGNQVKGF
jgi:low affinity Fe/Cu permease